MEQETVHYLRKSDILKNSQRETKLYELSKETNREELKKWTNDVIPHWFRCHGFFSMAWFQWFLDSPVRSCLQRK